MVQHLEIPEVARGARKPLPESIFIEAEPIYFERVYLWRAVPLATRPALSRTLAKLATEVIELGLKRDPRVPALRAELGTKLEANRAVLTADGTLQLAFLLHERARDAANGAPPDHRETFAAIQLVLARKPDPFVHAIAMHLEAVALSELEDDDANRKALTTWLELVTRFPDASKVVDAAYAGLAQLALADFPEARPHAIPVNRWLATNATGTRRASAQYRLGRLYDAERDRPAARTSYCQVVDADLGPHVEQATTRLARGFLDTDFEPLRAACETQTCPCVEPVLAELIRDLIQTEDDARAREVLELALAAKPAPSDNARWSCQLVQLEERAESPRAAALRAALPAGTTCDAMTRVADSVISIEHFMRTSPGLERCLDDAMVRGQWKPMRLRLELVTGGDGRVERSTVVGSTFDPETAHCIERTVKRHRFVGIARTAIVIPFRFAP